MIVIALHSDGSINHIPLDLKMIPDYSENATYEQDFIRTKVIHDRDRIFAGIVLNDMYGKDNSATGIGVINLQAHLTSMVIPDISQVFALEPASGDTLPNGASIPGRHRRGKGKSAQGK